MHIFDQIFINPNIVHKTNNNIFYHLLCINDGFDRWHRTYTKIINSGLIHYIDNIYVNLVGTNKYQYFNQINSYKKTIPRIGLNDTNESETLNLILDFSKNQTNGRVLYLHSKGVTRTFQKNVCRECIQDWIDCMEYFLIEEHQTALDYLKIYSTCGVNLKAMHYSGNFWWATTEHISKLSPCRNAYLYCEHHFLRSTKASGTHKMLHKTTIHWPQWLSHRYPRNSYTNKPEII
jgi:hypothetical protein